MRDVGFGTTQQFLYCFAASSERTRSGIIQELFGFVVSMSSYWFLAGLRFFDLSNRPNV